jgi:uncharacterized protein (DUF952 family)
MVSQESMIHVATDEDWARRQPDGGYVPPGFAQEGFIHCCHPSQLARVLRDFFANQDRVLLLVLDPSLIAPEIKYENVIDGMAHPHIYGSLDPQAVVRELSLVREAGGWPIPADL